MSPYVPGTLETDLKKIIMSLQQIAATASGIVGGSGISVSTSGTTTTVSQSLTNATFQSSSSSNPTGTASTAMMGLGSTFKITPVYSGRVNLTIRGESSNTSAGAAVQIQAMYGTGTAPSNGGASSGTAIGPNLHNTSATASANVSFNAGGVITGLTVGTAYWFDLKLVTGAGTASVADVQASIIEF